jgi:DNA-binding SARP family transcriptional activator
MVELRVFGPLELRGGDGAEVRALLAQPKRVALLAYLAVATPRGFHQRDRLLALFWPELDQEHARAALRKAVHVIRRAVGDGVLVSRGDAELGVDVEALRCDAAEFDDAIERGRLARALELYRGELLDGFFVDAAVEFEEWLQGERTRTREAAALAAWALAQRFEIERQFTVATRWARIAAKLAPTDERALRNVIVMLDRLGDRAGAVRVYEEFAQRLARELDVAPSRETQALIAEVRAR